MLITIIADASHCPDTHAAGYAYWMASDRGKLFGSGSMHNPCDSSVIAEMMALVKGVYYGIKDGIIHPGDKLCMQTDCVGAIQKLQKLQNVSPAEEVVTKYFNKITSQLSLTFYFTHVRGHTKVQDGRSFINRKCDKKARHHMQLMRSSLKIKTIRETLV